MLYVDCIHTASIRAESRKKCVRSGDGGRPPSPAQGNAAHSRTNCAPWAPPAQHEGHDAGGAGVQLSIHGAKSAPVRAPRSGGSPRRESHGGTSTAAQASFARRSRRGIPCREACIPRAVPGFATNKHAVLFPWNVSQNVQLAKCLFPPRFFLTARVRHHILYSSRNQTTR